jgi:hypothetical protein
MPDNMCNEEVKNAKEEEEEVKKERYRRETKNTRNK